MDQLTKAVEGFPSYVAHRGGWVCNRVTGKICERVGEGKKYVHLNVSGKIVKRSLGKLLLLTFAGEPRADGNTWLVGFKDGNDENYQVENLEWITTQELQIRAAERIRAEILKQFPIPKFDETNTGLYPNPIECPQKPGYYYIPFTNMPIVINRYGRLFNLATDEEHPVHLHPKWYVLTMLSTSNKYQTFKVHRLVAMLFVGRPNRHLDKSTDELHVNHIDGMVANNHDENLEWVTNIENQRHARDAGLFDNDKPVLGRNVVSGEVIHFRSVSMSARHAVIRPSAMSVHLNSVAAGRIISNDFVYKFDNGEPWPTELAVEDEEVTLGRVTDVIAENVETGEKLLTLSIAHACRLLKLSRIGLNNFRQWNGFNKPYQGWIFYNLE